MSRVLFLDYDGVINRRMWMTLADGTTRYTSAYPEDGRVNDAEAVARVSDFCEAYGYDVVVTSTWRKYPEWETCLRGGGLRESVRILGCTSVPTRAREAEISDYIAEHPEIETFLVLDDSPELLAACPDLAYPSDVHGGPRGTYDPDRLPTDALALGGYSLVHHLIPCDKERGFDAEAYGLAVAKHLHFHYRRMGASAAPDAYVIPGKVGLSCLSDCLYRCGQLEEDALRLRFRENGEGGDLYAAFRFLCDNGCLLPYGADGEGRLYLPTVSFEQLRSLVAEGEA